jgi:hypothetical protein
MIIIIAVVMLMTVERVTGKDKRREQLHHPCGDADHRVALAQFQKRPRTAAVRAAQRGDR